MLLSVQNLACFKLNENQNAGGAIRESRGDSSKSECEAVCLSKSSSECTAYEFNRENNECWIHATKPSSLNSANGIDHYTREQCPSTNGLYIFKHNKKQIFETNIKSFKSESVPS